MRQLSDTELKALIPPCKKGDQSAQRAIFKALYGKMLVVCMRYYNDVDYAQDILQEAFIKVFKNMHKYNGDGSFEGWVRRIVTNTAIDDVRKRKYEEVSIDASDHDWLEDEGGEEIAWNEVLFKNRARVLEAIQNLTPAYQSVFNLYVVEGYSHKEIADLLGISIGTSKSNLSKAKMNLKKALIKLVE
jgi:RNA polymerase sigma-70 factor (ECF subfamily)